MKRPLAIRFLVALTLTCPIAVNSTAQSQARSPAAPQHPPRKPQGFFDYALGKVNPNGNDYGASLQARRDDIVDHSVDDLYFWSNVATLLLLCGTSSVVFLQWRSAEKKEVIAASLIAELWNGRVSDRVELETRTGQFNRLVATHNAEVEKSLSTKETSAEREKEAAGNLDRGVRRVTEKPAKTNGKAAVEVPAATETTSTSPTHADAANSKQSNLLLQRQVEAMQNSEQNLKQRLNQMTLLLDQERRRNASLKGA